MVRPPVGFWTPEPRHPLWMATLTALSLGVVGLWWLLVALAELKEFNRGDGSGIRGCGGWLILAFLFGPLVVMVPFLLLTRDLRLAYVRAGQPDGFRLLWSVILVVTPVAVWGLLWWHPDGAADLDRNVATVGTFIASASLFIYQAQRSMNELWHASVGFADPQVAEGVVLPASRRLADLPSGKYTRVPEPGSDDDTDDPADELDELQSDPTTSHA